MHSHLHQNQNPCVEQPLLLLNGPKKKNPPRTSPEQIPMDDVSPQCSEAQHRQLQVIPGSDLTGRLEVKSPPDNPALHTERKQVTADRPRLFSGGTAALKAEINK